MSVIRATGKEKIETNTRGVPIRKRVVTRTALVLLALCLAWCVGFWMLRLGEDPIADIESSSGDRVGKVEWSQVDSRGLQVVSRPVVDASSGTTGHVLMGSTGALPAGSWLAGALAAPRHIEIAILVDDSFVVRGIWAANTSNPVVVGASWSDVKSRFRGVSGFLLLSGYAGKPSDDATLDTPLSAEVGETVVRLLQESCSHQFGKVLSDAFSASRSDRLSEPDRFPYVAAYDVNERLTTSQSWLTKPLVIATVNPACGHCIIVVRKALDDARAAQKDCVRVVVLRASASAGLSVQFLATLPADTLVLPDEDGDLSRMLHLEPAPTVALIRTDGSVAGRYSAYRIDAVDEAIGKSWAGVGG